MGSKLQKGWEVAKALWIWDYHLQSVLVGLGFGAASVLLVVYIKMWRSSRRRQRASQRLERVYLERLKRKQ